MVATAYDTATTDGVNEAGLSAHLLWLAEAGASRLVLVQVMTWIGQRATPAFAIRASAVTRVQSRFSAVAT